MATLYVENVPEELYKALRERARGNRKSVSAEVLSLLAENVPTAAELKRRREFFRRIQRMRSSGSRSVFPSTEEMQREDRAR
jgi:plasmid stability protein